MHHLWNAPAEAKPWREKENPESAALALAKQHAQLKIGSTKSVGQT